MRALRDGRHRKSSHAATLRTLAYNKAGLALADAFELLELVNPGAGPDAWQPRVVLNEVYGHLQFCAECFLDIDANVIGQDTRERLRRMCRE